MRQLINISLLLIGIITLAGCRKSFLEVIPLGNQVATTAEDFDKIMNEPDYYYTQEAGLNEAVLMGDELAAEGPYFNNVTEYNTRLFQWSDSIYIMTDQSPFFITRNLDKMYTLNLVIQQVMD